MITPRSWTDYELIDATDGERLERWGKYILVRPDPQVIWKTEKKNILWKKCHGYYKRSEKGGGSWVKNDTPERWNISYGDVKMIVSPMGFKHTGVFPEQAANWEWFSELIKKEDREIRVLNLFAYTGGATVAAAKAGAFVCHCDASKGMVARAKENANLSGVPQDRIRYIVDDCLKFVEREIRRGKKYDGIIMDPPSYGRGSNGEVWQMEQMADELVKRTAMLLSDEPLFFLLNSYTTGLSASSCGCLLDLYVKNRFGGKVENDELGLMITDKGMALPCGAASRWTRE
ncbi:MAG: class I SAM-dependent methyltransferase [Clostridia bacterium]|nr:class I SAM-dependent methyltransferase [Clostridia bacterium]MBQ6906120.1 class I SAM-dependent methyltransferase [Clostridia bacterium]